MQDYKSPFVLLAATVLHLFVVHLVRIQLVLSLMSKGNRVEGSIVCKNDQSYKKSDSHTRRKTFTTG